jgi:hypothetical protein
VALLADITELAQQHPLTQAVPGKMVWCAMNV